MSKQKVTEPHAGPFLLGDPLPPEVKITRRPPKGFPKNSKAAPSQHRPKKPAAAVPQPAESPKTENQDPLERKSGSLRAALHQDLWRKGRVK